ncbi:hypothetical protein ACWDR0_00135 [Streptomyces sp. NPDC003691]
MTELAELVLTPGERADGVRVDSVVFSMDWTGEEEPGELAAFVAARVRTFGAEPYGIGTEGVPHTDEGDPALRRGDLPVRLLDHLAAALAESGGTLLAVENGTDTYEILVAPAVGSAPDGLMYGGSPVRAWGSVCEAPLTSLNCPGCTAMLVWEVPDTRVLAGERCDCGTALFDDGGRPLPGVALHD